MTLVTDNAIRLFEQEYRRIREDDISHTREDCHRRGLEAAAPAIVAAHQATIRRTVTEAGPRCPSDPEAATAWLREKAYRFAGNARAVTGPAADRQWAIFLTEIAAYAAAAQAAGAPPPATDPPQPPAAARKTRTTTRKAASTT